MEQQVRYAHHIPRVKVKNTVTSKSDSIFKNTVTCKKYLMSVGLVSGLRGAGVNSGFMIAHCTAAALVSENKVLCHPASVDSVYAGEVEDA